MIYFREFFNSVHEDACIHNFTSDFGEKIDVIYKMSHFSFDNSFPIVMVAQKKKILHKCTHSSIWQTISWQATCNLPNISRLQAVMKIGRQGSDLAN